MKNLAWKEVYKLPLTLDEYGSDYAFTKDNVMALMFDDFVSDVLRKRIVDMINGYEGDKTTGIITDGADFFKDGKYIFCVRGWGYLTGTGALNLSEKKALEIQNGFIDHVFKSLTV